MIKMSHLCFENKWGRCGGLLERGGFILGLWVNKRVLSFVFNVLFLINVETIVKRFS